MSTVGDAPTATRAASGTYTARWGSKWRTTYAALFRLAGMVAVLQHIRWVETRQWGETTSGLDAEPNLADVPDSELVTLRDRGYRLTEGGI